MRKSRFTEAQIVGILKQSEAGTPTKELCRQHGVSPQTESGSLNVTLRTLVKASRALRVDLRELW